MALLMLNGVLRDSAEATVPATDRGLTHGLGLYETLKLVGGVPVFFDEHAARLEQGMATLGLEPPFDRLELATQVCRLSEAAAVPDGACRILVTLGPPEGRPTVLIQVEVRPFPARPLRVVTYRGVRVSAQLKAMTVMQSYLAQRRAAAAGADDALLVDDLGRIFEGATSNAFVVRSGGLITPPAEGDILPGVMRATVERLAAANGIPVIEAWVRVVELRPDDGLLLTSSVRGIVAVERVDDRALTVPDGVLARVRALVADEEAASRERFRAAYPAALAP